MPWSVDARVPVLIGRLEDAEGDDALLIEGSQRVQRPAVAHFEVAERQHAPGCACCAPLSPVAFALRALFQARAKGDVPFFRRVVAVTRTEEGDVAVWSAIRNDPLTAGRFRLAG